MSGFNEPEPFRLSWWGRHKASFSHTHTHLLGVSSDLLEIREAALPRIFVCFCFYKNNLYQHKSRLVSSEMFQRKVSAFFLLRGFFYLYSKVWLLQYLKWHHPDILTSLNYIDPGLPQQLLIDHSRNWAEKEKKGQNNDDLKAVLLFKCLPCVGIQSPDCSL